MAPSRPSPVLGRAVELLLEVSDPAQRARILLQAVQALYGAHSAALCRPRADGSWARIALLGEAEALPSLEQVAAVAAGALPRHLPPHRAVFVAGEDLALALCGIEQDDAAGDGLEALLCVYAAIAAVDPGSGGLEEVESPLPPPAGRWEVPGTALGEAPDPDGAP
jgi:hypothetical protein